MLVREKAPAHQITAVSSNGLRSRWASDEIDASRVPSGLRWSTSIPGGSDTLTCTLPRDPERSYPDLGLLTDLQVVRDGGRTLTYRLEEVPKVSGDQMAVEPAAKGYRAALEDRADARALFVDRDMSAWQPMSAALRRTLLTANYDLHDFSVAADVNSGLPSLLQTLTGPWGTRGQVVWTTYDAGDGLTVAYVYYDFLAYNNTADADFQWIIRVSDKDDHTGTNYDTSDLQAASGSGFFTPTLPLRYANLQHLHTTSAGSDGVSYEVQWRKLAVYGNHGLTRQTYNVDQPGGFYTGQMVGWVIANLVPSLSTGTVDNGTFIHPHAVYKDGSTPLSIVENLTRVEPLYDWMVWDREFNLQRRGTYGRRWRARVGSSNLRASGQSLERLYNEVAVKVSDPLYGDLIVGPTGSGYSNTSASLIDSDPDNPANQAGITRRATLDMGTGTAAGAIEVGRRFLEETKRLDNSGQCELTGYVEDDSGSLWPVDEVRAGDEIQFTDAADSSWRHIAATDYSADTQTNALSLDAPPQTIDALLARLQASLLPLG